MEFLIGPIGVKDYMVLCDDLAAQSGCIPTSYASSIGSVTTVNLTRYSKAELMDGKWENLQPNQGEITSREKHEHTLTHPIIKTNQNDLPK